MKMKKEPLKCVLLVHQVHEAMLRMHIPNLVVCQDIISLYLAVLTD